jgi:hypothetical protein
MSFSVNSILSPILLPLFKMDRCERQTAFGIEVVPELNWILTTSSGCRWRSGSDRPGAPSSSTFSNIVVHLRGLMSTRPAELSTRITQLQ